QEKWSFWDRARISFKTILTSGDELRELYTPEQIAQLDGFARSKARLSEMRETDPNAGVTDLAISGIGGLMDRWGQETRQVAAIALEEGFFSKLEAFSNIIGKGFYAIGWTGFADKMLSVSNFARTHQENKEPLVRSTDGTLIPNSEDLRSAGADMNLGDAFESSAFETSLKETIAQTLESNPDFDINDEAQFQQVVETALENSGNGALVDELGAVFARGDLSSQFSEPASGSTLDAIAEQATSMVHSAQSVLRGGGTLGSAIRAMDFAGP
ncbi:MAG: hypothetical protein AAF244_02185, partial [Pseudomonadota bacterium]